MSSSHTKIIDNKIFENLKFLKIVGCSKSQKKRQMYLKNASVQELLCIVEICINILNSRFVLSNTQKNRLLPYVNYIRKLAQIKSYNTVKRIVQKGDGGFFSALLVPIIIEAGRQLLLKNGH